MKRLYITLLALVIIYSSRAQLTVYIDPVTKDSVISTAFDTLKVAKDDTGKSVITDKVVAIRNVHNKVPKYWLFFYFLPTDMEKKQTINIGQGKYAYFLNDKGTYLRIPYTGKPYTYKYPKMAGFFVDVSNYLNQLKDTKINFIRFETSDLYHEINFKDSGTYKIAAVLQKLLNG